MRKLLPITVFLSFLLVASLALALSGQATQINPSEAEITKEQTEAILAKLSLQERAGQLIMTSVPNVFVSQNIRTILERERFGGVIIFSNNYRSHTQLRILTKTISGAISSEQNVPKPLISIDQEGGVVKRISDAPPFRSHLQLGKSLSSDSTYKQAKAAASVLARLGINMNLAPVADLDLPPRRVMHERSFGSNPTLVSKHVNAFISGTQDTNVAAVVKHFPGFGAANVNSDYAVASVDRSKKQLDEADLAPFRSAIATGVDAVMVSHAIYKNLDRRYPASLSPIVYELLRKEMGFSGVVITDSLHASGFSKAAHATVPTGCVRAVTAGADVVLLTGELRDAMLCRRQIVLAARRNDSFYKKVNTASLRILELKNKLGLLS